jgi:putative copper resistance protein D
MITSSTSGGPDAATAVETVAVASVTTWQFAPFVTAATAVLAAGYLAGAWRLAAGAGRRRQARLWPGARTLAFLGGLGTITVATQGWVGVHDETSLADHMIQHLLLIMVAPPLLILGRPLTLLLHTVGNPWHTRVKRILRSRPLTALTWPPAGVALYSAAVLGTHLTGLLLAGGAVHEAEHAAYLAAGYLYFLPVVASEPIRWRVPALGRYLLILAAMPADMATGAVLMLHGPLGPYTAGDVRAAGVIMLAGSDLIMTGLAVALAASLLTRRGKTTASPADLAAYNARLASLEAPDTR